MLTGVAIEPATAAQNFRGGVFFSNAYNSTVRDLSLNGVLVGRAGDGLLFVILSEGVGGDFDGLTITPPGGSAVTPDLLSDALPVTDETDTVILRAWLWQLVLTQEFIDEVVAGGAGGTFAFSTSTALTDGILVAGVLQADDGDATAAVVETGDDARNSASFTLSVTPADPSEIFLGLTYARALGAANLNFSVGTERWENQFGSGADQQDVIGVAEDLSGQIDVTTAGTPSFVGMHYWTLRQVVVTPDAHQLPHRPLVGVRPLPYEVRDSQLNVDERHILGILP